MSEDKIRFSCGACGKVLAIAASHAGKTAKCPACAQVIQIPSDSPAVSTPSPFSSPASNPPAASGGSVFGDGDFGALRPPISQSPSAPSSAQTPRSPYSPQTSNSSGDYNAPHAPQPAPAKRRASMGASIGGLLAAMAVGFVCCVLWLVIVAVTERELGILAWAIGGLIGLVAGAIARNRSPIYCGATAAIAVGSILMAKFIMVLFIMLFHAGLNFADSMMDGFSDQTEKHLLVDHLLAENQLTETEQKQAKQFNSGFFDGFDSFDEFDGMDETDGEVEILNQENAIQDMMTFRSKISDMEKAASAEQKAQWRQEARARHPNWIENEFHYLAVVELLNADPGALEESMAAHVQHEIEQHDNPTYGSNDAYREGIPPKEYSSRSKALRSFVAEKIRTMTAEELDNAMRDSLRKHASYRPFQDAYTATMDQMCNNNEFQGPLKNYAQSQLQESLGKDEGIGVPFDQQLEAELGKAINQKLADKTPAERETLVAELRAREPEWLGTAPGAMAAQNAKLKREIGGDGSFWGSVAQVFHPIDLLWFFLGAATAYGTAQKMAARSDD